MGGLLMAHLLQRGFYFLGTEDNRRVKFLSSYGDWASGIYSQGKRKNAGWIRKEHLPVPGCSHAIGQFFFFTFVAKLGFLCPRFLLIVLVLSITTSHTLTHSHSHTHTTMAILPSQIIILNNEYLTLALLFALVILVGIAGNESSPKQRMSKDNTSKQ